MRPSVQSLHQPYPFYYTPARLLRLGLTLAGCTAAFLYLLRPVGVEQGLALGLLTVCLVYGAVAGAVFIAYFGLLPKLLPSAFSPDSWTVLREAAAFAGLFLAVGLVNHAVQPLLYETAPPRGLAVLAFDLKNTFLVGALILGIITAINFMHLVRTQEEKAALLRLILRGETDESVPKGPTPARITIASRHGDFEVDGQSLRYAMADGNYVELIHDGADGTKRELQRITLKLLEEQLQGHPHLMQVHRAYIVNLRAIEEVSGNAQGYQLRLRGTDHRVPVSRTYMEAFNQRLTALRAA